MTCKLNEQFALNTKLTSSTLKDQNVIVLKADMTEDNIDIENKLVEFGNTAKAIPYYAVYRPGEAPHHFDGNFVTVGAKGFLDRAGIVSNKPLADGELATRPFSKSAVDAILANGKPVLVYFSADWDITSKLNEKFAFNTELTRSVINEQGVVVLKADMTDDSPEAEELLVELGNAAKAIPYYVLFRPDEEPLHFDGNFVRTGSRGFLKRAGLLPELTSGVTNVSGATPPKSNSDADARIVPAG